MSVPAHKIADDPLVEAVYAKLDGALTDLDGNNVPVYEALKRDSSGHVTAEEPYVVIDLGESLDHSSNTTVGQETPITVNVWSDYQGQQEASHIASQIIEALDRTTFDLSSDGHNNFHGKYETHFPRRVPDEETGRTLRHVAIEMTYLTQVTA